MRYSHLLTLEREAKLSPEQLAEKLGVSGMTLRRWRDQPGEKDLPALYAKALIGVIYQLVNEGRLSIGSSSVKVVVAEQGRGSGSAAPLDPALPGGLLRDGACDPQRMTQELFETGSNEFKRGEIAKNESRILAFKRRGREWAVRVSSLMTILKSGEIQAFDKLVAYGALFYLINPFDIIPDYIPLFGYVDDFFVLGLAMAYYLKRFPHFLKKYKN